MTSNGTKKRGRPKRFKEKPVYLRVLVDQVTVKALDELAEQKGMDRSQLVRRIINMRVKPFKIKETNDNRQNGLEACAPCIEV